MRSFVAVAAVLGLFVVAGGVRADEKVAPPKAEKVAVDQLPKMVTDTAKLQVPNGEIKSAELMTENGLKFYLLKIKQGETERMVKVTTDGKIVVDPTMTDNSGRRRLLRRGDRMRRFSRR